MKVTITALLLLPLVLALLLGLRGDVLFAGATTRIALTAGNYSLEPMALPDLLKQKGMRYFARNLQRTHALTAVSAGFCGGDGERHLAEGTRQTPLAQTPDDGWRHLFDGHTLTGWRNYGRGANDIRKWTVQDGTLALVQEGPFPMWDLLKSVIFGGPSGDLIYYRETFRDFELSLQWKISPGGNSGIFYLVADEKENAVWGTGIEMQVLDNEGHADGQIANHRAGDLYDLIAAKPETVRPPGEWNDVLLRIKENHIEHWLNGVKVLSVERGSSEWDTLVGASKFAQMPRFGKSAVGYIALQDHGDPVWYRNIRVRDL